MTTVMKRWNTALALGAAAAMLLGLWQSAQAPRLSDKLIRLHVVAASDDPADQAAKLVVRDAVLARAQPLLEGAQTVEEAREALDAGLPALQLAAEQAAAGETAVVSLGTTWFPQKSYDTFSLPEGEYQALRVVLGSGEGQNWWCVVFPSLCLCATTQEVTEVAAAAGFSSDELALLTDADGVVFRWRLWELLKDIFT